MNKKISKDMTPMAARLALGLTQVDLAAGVPCALSTVYKCEFIGRYPVQRTLRAAYLRALRLDELHGKITRQSLGITP